MDSNLLTSGVTGDVRRPLNIYPNENVTGPLNVSFLTAAINSDVEPFRERAQNLPQIVDESRNTILHVHIGYFWTQSAVFVEEILRICPSLLLQVNDKGDTPMHVAVKYHNKYVIARALLKCARDQSREAESEMLQIKNNDGKTIFDLAVQLGNTEVVKLLIKEGDPEVFGLASNMDKIFSLAAKKGDHEMVAALEKCLNGKPALQAVLMKSNIPGRRSKDTIFHMHIKFSETPSTEFVQKVFDICPLLLPQINEKGDTPFHVAAQYGKSAIVEVLLRCASDKTQEPDSRDDLLRMKNADGKTTLDIALENDEIEVAKKLIKAAHPDFLHFNNNINKILIFGAKKGDPEIVVQLPERLNGMPTLEMALTPTISNIPGSKDTILHFHIKASQSPSTEFVKKVLDICPSLVRKVNAKGDTPLHVAAKCGQSAIVEILLEFARHQGDPESEPLLGMMNGEKNTALHEAVRHGKINVVEILTKEPYLDFPYAPNNAGETPLYLASARGYSVMVETLLRSRQPVTYGGPNEMTALHAAVLSDPGGSSTHIMEEILMKTKNLTATQDKYGWTPLHYAAYHGFKDKVSLLLKYDKSAAYIRNNDRKMTALHMAASQGHKDIIEEIISQCVECSEIVDHRGWNVLHFAMLSLSKKELVNLLKNPLVGSLIDKKDFKGNTPLHLRAAAYRDSFSLIGDRHAFNNKNISVEHILDYGSPELEKEIQKLSEDIGKAQYLEGVIRERKDEDYFKVRDEQRKKYYDGLKETRSSHLLVATLIATVTFTAAFTIPGGYSNENGLDQGTAILRKDLAFQIFIITDAVAMALSLSAVFVYFVMSFRKFQKNQILFTFALCLTILAMVGVVVAFVAGMYAVLAPSLRLARAACSVALIFFFLALCTLILINLGVFRNWLCQIWNGRGRIPFFKKRN